MQTFTLFCDFELNSIVALGHCVTKSNGSFCSPNFMHLIVRTMLSSIHFLYREYRSYSNNALCRNEHDFAKSTTPIIRGLSQLFYEFESASDIGADIEEDVVIQIVEDLQELMVIGTGSNDGRKSGKEEKPSTSTNTDSDAGYSEDATRPMFSEYQDYSQRDRHRFRNRVLLDWNGEQYRHGNYTSDSVLETAERSEVNVDRSFFVPFDVFRYSFLSRNRFSLCPLAPILDDSDYLWLMMMMCQQTEDVRNVSVGFIG